MLKRFKEKDVTSGVIACCFGEPSDMSKIQVYYIWYRYTYLVAGTRGYGAVEATSSSPIFRLPHTSLDSARRPLEEHPHHDCGGSTQAKPGENVLRFVSNTHESRIIYEGNLPVRGCSSS
jgi:hypothetical protein